jgi:hypothetical protein
VGASRPVIEPLITGAVTIFVAVAGLVVRRYNPSKPAGHRELLDQTPPGRGHDALAVQLQIDAFEAVRDACPTARRMRRTSRIMQVAAIVNLAVIFALMIYLAAIGVSQADAPDGVRLIMGGSMGCYLIVFLLFGLEARSAGKDEEYARVLAWIEVLRRQLTVVPGATPCNKSESSARRWWHRKR